MIGLIIDSSSQIPSHLVAKYDVEVVPITVTIDDETFREGVDIDADAFYEMVGEPLPDIGTSQPSPGQFVEAFERSAARGAEELLVVTMADKHSGTHNSARLAADLVDVPVRLVNSGTMSFGVTACFWEAAAAIERGASLEQAAERAESLGPEICSTFILQSLAQVEKMGRVDTSELAVPPRDYARPGEDTPGPGEETGVYTTKGADLAVAGAGSTVEELCRIMIDQLPTDVAVRTGVCFAAPETAPFTILLEAELSKHENVVDMVRYRVGPSVAAHTGPGTAGFFWWPAT